MPITQAEAQAATLAFTRDYPGALELIYHFRESTGELYGHRAAEVPADLKGGYLSKEHIHNGRSYRGRVDVPLGNMDDAADLLVTLRHEVLGHYGANTFKPAEKRALLDGLIAAREEPSLKPRWEDINRRYAGASMDVRAEEVWALYCETLAPGQHVGQAKVRERGEQSFMETCIARVRPMQPADMHNIVCMVADGLHDRSRTQQTFPQINELFRRDEALEPKKPFHEVVAEKLIEQLKAGTAPWQRPWEVGQTGTLPMNYTTGKRYRGINSIQLMMQGREDNRWLTYKQAEAVGAQVRRGERGTLVQYWKFDEERTKTDEQGRPVQGADGQPEKERVRLERPKVFHAVVFNAEQIDGLPPAVKLPQRWDAIERAESILKASGADIGHAAGDRAFYRPSTDSITMPYREQFKTAEAYYAIALHELGHWTGHESRLGRDLANPFGSEAYAKEELRAEIASMIVGDELGIGHDPGQHAAYVKSWVKVLKDDPMEILRAAADAEKIRGFVMAFEQKQVQELGQAQGQAQQQQQAQQAANHSLTEAREREQQLRTDPNATEDQIMWAKEERKAREFEGVKEDRKQRAAEWTPDQAAARAAADVEQYQEQPGGIERDYQLDDMALNAAANPHYRAALAKLAPEVLEPQKNDQAQPLAQGQRQYVDVPFKEKDQAKSLGAKWDRAEQSWYIPPGVNPEPFGRWAVKGAEKGAEAPTAAERPGSNTQVATGQDNAPTSRVYLAVPYTERMEAKAAGAAWDKAAKSWYVGLNADMAKLERWKPENVKAQQDPAMTPREEFAEALRSMQCVVDGEHPIMDGQRHRIKVVGDTGKEQAGFYVGHSDGHPAGYIKNNRSGEELRWKSMGYSMSDEDKAKMRAEAAEKLAERAAQQERAQGAIADRLAKQMASLVPAGQPTAYMRAKGITSHAGAFTDAEGQKTYLPATDVDGKVWTMQYIQEDGTKRFAKDSRKEGCFHSVGGLDGLANAPALVIAEGYATAATLAESLGHATVAAFDSGNLKAVAQALHAKYPDKPVIVAGDDDRHLPMTLGNNPGREKAIEAAAAVGGQAIFPVFAPGEASWPADVPAITPDTFKKHQAAVTALEAGGQTPEQDKALKADLLSQAQLDALANLKRHTDFNDLATRSSLGRDGATRQAGAAVSLADERKAEKAELAEQQTLKQKQARGNDADEQQQQEAHRPRKAAKIR